MMAASNEVNINESKVCVSFFEMFFFISFRKFCRVLYRAYFDYVLFYGERCKLLMDLCWCLGLFVFWLLRAEFDLILVLISEAMMLVLMASSVSHIWYCQWASLLFGFGDLPGDWESFVFGFDFIR